MPKLIDLVYSNGSVFVWSAEDWLTLRKDYRIIGELIGCLPKLPRQQVLSGLPLLLLPEEVSLLLEKRIARIICHPCSKNEPDESSKKTFEEYREKLYIEQEICLREERRRQVTAMMDTIVEGKRRKIYCVETGRKKLKKPLDRETEESLKMIEIDRDALLDDEMAKLPKLEKSEVLLQTHTADPWSRDIDVPVMEWRYPLTSEEVLRYRTYRDLWERRYYITGGGKFGGDFLVYPGDPVMFHSQFIIQCRDGKEEINITDLVGQCRIGCHVRKTQVFAMLTDDGQDVEYQSFCWAESNLS